MSKKLSPKYNPAEVEAGRYQKWLDADVFKPSGDQKAKPYSIVIPPPNVTGKRREIGRASCRERV